MPKLSMKAKAVLIFLFALAVIYLLVKLDNSYQKNRVEPPQQPQTPNP